jgi:hypothetical protein
MAQQIVVDARIHEKPSKHICPCVKKIRVHLVEEHAIEPFVQHQHVKNDAKGSNDFMAVWI